MSTFAQLANKVKIYVDYPVDRIQLFRDAENDFIQRTLCQETYLEQSVNSETQTVSFPSGLIEVHRLEWDGRQLEPAQQSNRIQVNDSEADPYLGVPYNYWIQNDKFLLIPTPSGNGKLGIWYTKYNTDDDATSPIIPVVEQIKLVPYVEATMLEMNDREDRAAYYWRKYNDFVIDTEIKYITQRHSQGVLYPDAQSGGAGFMANAQNEYIWKGITMSDVLTEQTFVTGAGQLTATALDSAQGSLPDFDSNDTFVVEEMARYQDRSFIITTAPTVNDDSEVTFGLTLSAAGDSGTATFDLKLTVIDN